MEYPAHIRLRLNQLISALKTQPVSSLPFQTSYLLRQVQYRLTKYVIPEIVATEIIRSLSTVPVNLLYLKILVAVLFIFSSYDNEKISNGRTKVLLWLLLQRDEKSHKHGELLYLKWP